MPLSTGDRLGPYEILAPIGAGGMGEVWKARDTRLGRTVAIKILSGAHAERFTREAQAIAALNHPHICTLHDVGPDYLVMEYLEGAPLRGPLAAGEAVRVGLEIAGALAAAHSQGIIHRDLKPANILVTRAGVKLLDFGLAKMAQPSGFRDEAPTETQAGTILGTAAYMSPEQAEGKPVDARSDIFSFGIVLYELLSGPPRIPGRHGTLYRRGDSAQRSRPASRAHGTRGHHDAVPAEIPGRPVSDHRGGQKRARASVPRCRSAATFHRRAAVRQHERGEG